jgi:hypothetical protein
MTVRFLCRKFGYKYMPQFTLDVHLSALTLYARAYYGGIREMVLDRKTVKLLYVINASLQFLFRNPV